jgi:excisionase family DNA binding protein
MSQSSCLKSLSESAELLGVSIFTLRRLIDRGAVRSVTVGARRLIHVSEIERITTHGAGVPRSRKRQ